MLDRTIPKPWLMLFVATREKGELSEAQCRSLCETCLQRRVFITNGVSELVHDTCIEYTGQLYNNRNKYIYIYTYYKIYIILYKIYIIATLVYKKSVFFTEV